MLAVPRAPVGRRRSALLCVAVLVVSGLHPTPVQAVTSGDRWSAVGTFRTQDGWYASPIHANLLPDGRILFVGLARSTDPPTVDDGRRVAWIFRPPARGAEVPATTTITEVAEPAELTNVPYQTWTVTDDLYCMGSVLDAQGRVITAGGSRQFRTTTGDKSWVLFGLPYLTTFDGRTWTRSKTMVGTGDGGSPGRWYPTLTRLPSGKILVTGGFEAINAQDPAKVVGVPNLSMETYDPTSGAQQVVSTKSQTPRTIQAGDYTHTFVLPYPTAAKDLVMFGDNGLPIFGRSTTPGSYQAYPIRRPGGDEVVNIGASTVQLPIRVGNGQWGYRNGSVLTVAGAMHTRFEHSADLFDLAAFSWRPGSIELDIPRHHPSTVLLPDGRVLVVNGHDMHGGTGVTKAQYIDPRRQFAVTTGAASSGVVRGYHSVALLLPDGRVLVAGGRDQNRDTSLEKPTWQIYEPSYPTGPAPVLVDGPAQIGYGSRFSYSSVGPPPAELVLVALGAMTHSFDMGQRQVELRIDRAYRNAAGASLTVTDAPADSHVAPPGYYWLFALSADGVPSSAKLVRVG